MRVLRHRQGSACDRDNALATVERHREVHDSGGENTIDG
jgi:hypothetical protein